MVYNKPTTDEHQPSKKIAATGTERGPSGLYINTKVREFIICNECSKVRCLFSEQDDLKIEDASLIHVDLPFFHRITSKFDISAILYRPVFFE